MAVRFFIPRAEQLEGKLLLAGVAADPGLAHPQSTEWMPAPELAVNSAPVSQSRVTFSTARLVNETVLVVRFGDSEPSATVRVVGGDYGLTQDDRSTTVRIDLESGPVDLVFGDLADEHAAMVRLEFSADGQIVRESWLDPATAPDEEHITGLVIAPDHTRSAHLGGAANLLFSATGDWSHAPGGEHGDSVRRTVDEVMTHDGGVEETHSDGSHGQSTAEFSRGGHGANTRIAPGTSEAAKTEAVAEHAGTGISQEATVPTAASLETNAIPAQGDESFETVVAGWTTGQEVSTVPGPHIESVLPQPFRGTETIDPAADKLQALGPVVFASFVAETELGPQPSDDGDSNRWPIVGAVVVSAAAAAGAWVLDRRAASQKTGASAPSHLL